MRSRENQPITKKEQEFLKRLPDAPPIARFKHMKVNRAADKNKRIGK